MFQTREDFENELLQKVKSYQASKFRGVGTFDKLFDTNKDLLISKCKEAGGIWMLYAICPYMGVDHNVHIGNYPPSTYTKYR